jgi:hypothetical protein
LITVEVQTKVEVDMGEVWGNMLGGHSGYWADNFETLDDGIIQWYVDDDYDKPNVQDFKVFAGGEWHEVTVQKLAEAYAQLKADGWRHCGGHPVDDEDSCTGDAILQMAAFGEFVYG